VANRTPYVGGNWKMNLDRAQAVELTQTLADTIDPGETDVAICPPYPYLATVSETLCSKGSKIKVGAQDCYHQPNGAFTGEVSLSQLQDVGAQVVILGHSERRHVIGESDTLINDKVLAALEANMEVILCVGETVEQREANKTHAINAGQLSYGLAGVTAQQMQRVVIAYEPVWAIGTGHTATPEDAQSAHAAIRCHLAGMFDDTIANATRIQYGGSMKAKNAGELLAQNDIDGGLIGGASLKPDEFKAIVDAAG
jgi:triosephosphate isomerase